jgi:nucleotide-binding universal stress UspA family protein
VRVVAWMVEGTWRACIDAVLELAPSDARVTLLYVVDDEVSSLASGAFAGRLGWHRRDAPSDPRADDVTAQAGRALLARAGERLGRPSTPELRRGRVEREVVMATEGADLLVVARDGDRRRLGPKSLGHASRFVVDHAPCSVVLVWPESTPDVATIPPSPGHGRPGPPPHPPK